MTFSNENPFLGPVPPTISLPQTPLTGVVVQIKFPEVLSISKPEFVADFQELVRADYPLHNLESVRAFDLMNESVQQSVMKHWRFLDTDRHWRLSLTTNFVALETRVYKSRLDFTTRVKAVLQALSGTIKPNFVTRIGVRFVDQIHGTQFKELDQYVRPEILGFYTRDHKGNINRTVSQVLGQTDTGNVNLRFGFMPPNSTHEPDLMPPISVPSWFLDIDVYNDFQQPAAFRAQALDEQVRQMATRAYGLFRWVVNNQFLRVCGGDI